MRALSFSHGSNSRANWKFLEELYDEAIPEYEMVIAGDCNAMLAIAALAFANSGQGR
jgi:hypothetical protein